MVSLMSPPAELAAAYIKVGRERGVRHEINNPVTAIKLHAQLLEGEPAASQATRDSLGIIVAEAAKIEGLVSQWMFLARPRPPQTSRQPGLLVSVR